MGKKNWVNNAISIAKRKDGKLTAYVVKDVELTKGTYLVLKSYEDHLQGLVKAGVITAEQAEEDWNKYGEQKLYVLDVPPEK